MLYIIGGRIVSLVRDLCGFREIFLIFFDISNFMSNFYTLAIILDSTEYTFFFMDEATTSFKKE